MIKLNASNFSLKKRDARNIYNTLKVKMKSNCVYAITIVVFYGVSLDTQSGLLQIVFLFRARVKATRVFKFFFS